MFVEQTICLFHTNKVMILQHRVSAGDVLGLPRDRLALVLGRLGDILGGHGLSVSEIMECVFINNSSRNAAHLISMDYHYCKPGSQFFTTVSCFRCVALFYMFFDCFANFLKCRFYINKVMII